MSLVVGEARADWREITLRAPLIYTNETPSVQGVLSLSGTFSNDGTDAWITGGFYTEDLPYISFSQITLNGDFAIVDSTGLDGAGSSGLTLQFQPGNPPTGRWFLPLDRAGHEIKLAEASSPEASPTMRTVSAWTVDFGGSSGTQLKLMSSYDPTKVHWFVDLTSREKSTNDGVTWVPDYTLYPLVPVTVYLNRTEAGHIFTVHSRVGQAPERVQSVSAAISLESGSVYDHWWSPIDLTNGSAVLSFSVGVGMEFWITRDADGVSQRRPMVTGWPTYQVPAIIR